MGRKVVRDDVIPAEHGMAFEIKKGPVLRIYLVEDHQVGDCVFYNAHDHKEFFHLGQTWVLSNFLGTGTSYSFKHFYSNAPRVNVMFTVLEDTVKQHSGHNSARCNARMSELIGRTGGERTCEQNLVEALAPYGLTAYEIVDCFNVFNNQKLRTDGTFSRETSAARKGDHIEMLAEMDILAGISACPSPTTINDYRPKPLGVQVLE